jgi:hypothetical protein
MWLNAHRSKVEVDARPSDAITLALHAGAPIYVVPEVGDNCLIAGIVSQDGKVTVIGIDPGDRLIRIDRMNISGASLEAVLSALHENPAISAPSQSTRMERKSLFRGR